jgi:hypothetical protein
MKKETIKSIEQMSYKEFSFVSDAKAFQRKLRKQGFKTRLKKYQGIANPYSVVQYWID